VHLPHLGLFICLYYLYSVCSDAIFYCSSTPSILKVEGENLSAMITT